MHWIDEEESIECDFRLVTLTNMKLFSVYAVGFVILLACNSLSQTRQSDREFEGLKGKVKSVLTETADATLKSGKVVEANRRKNEYLEFRLDGGDDKTIYYTWDSGLVRETTTYITVDGDKASISKLGPSAITGSINGSINGKPSKPRDPRYGFKLKYKYDDKGRISEEAWWANDGDLWLRYLYEYANGVRHETVFDEDGKLNQKYDYKLDAKGNDVEMIAYDVKTGKVHWKERYEYVSFDSHHNWTKRVEFESKSGSDSKFKVSEVEYRTLTYYE